jgi:DNA-binding transcriptional ArsR family regulator
MNPDPLSAKFAALAHPMRREMLARLSAGELTLTELASPFEMTVPAVAKHLRVLEGAGLISKGPRSQSRPVRLSPEGFADIATWISEHRQFWNDSFDRLDALLLKMETPDGA